jgi:hypothetical protein
MAPRFSHRVPDERAFLHTLRVYLEARGQSDVAALLQGAACSIAPTTAFSGMRWNALSTAVIFYVPAERAASFPGPARKALWLAADAVMPKDAGLDVERVDVVPFLEKAPALDPMPLNAGTLAGQAALEHDGLRFRSRPEICIYEALKRRRVLFFPNAAAVLGGAEDVVKKEPDFLICCEGNWGLLEVMGDVFHPGATAMKDHERARRFKDYGLIVIEFYDAARCQEQPDEVVDDFLRRLQRSSRG